MKLCILNTKKVDSNIATEPSHSHTSMRLIIKAKLSERYPRENFHAQRDIERRRERVPVHQIQNECIVVLDAMKSPLIYGIVNISFECEMCVTETP